MLLFVGGAKSAALVSDEPYLPSDVINPHLFDSVCLKCYLFSCIHPYDQSTPPATQINPYSLSSVQLKYFTGTPTKTEMLPLYSY